MDDSKPDTRAVSEAQLTAALRSGDTHLPSRLSAAIEAGTTIDLEQGDGSHIYLSTPVALASHLEHLRSSL